MLFPRTREPLIHNQTWIRSWPSGDQSATHLRRNRFVAFFRNVALKSRFVVALKSRFFVASKSRFFVENVASTSRFFGVWVVLIDVLPIKLFFPESFLKI